MQRMSILLVSLLTLMFSGAIFARDMVQQTCPVIPKDKTGAVKSVPAGCFDYYLRAQFWPAESCHAFSGANAKACTHLSELDLAKHLTPHGFWPNYHYDHAATYPVACTKEFFDWRKIPSPLREQMQRLYAVSPKLPVHEWSKHGTCTQKTQERYFAKIIEENTTPTIVQDHVGQSLDYQTMASGWGGAQYVSLLCETDKQDNKQYLSQVWTYYDKQMQKIARPDTYKIQQQCHDDQPIWLRQANVFS